MTSMWQQWARERRVVGLTHLSLTAIATAVAFLLLTIGMWVFAALMTLGAVALFVLAIHEFAWAWKYQKLEKGQT